MEKATSAASERAPVSKRRPSGTGTGRHSKKSATAAHSTEAGLKEILPDLEALYKYIHSHPELSMQETRTTKIAADRLRAAGYEVTTGIGKTGVVGLLRNGDGPTVVLRADMDALPVKEATGLPYASNVTAIKRIVNAEAEASGAPKPPEFTALH